MYNIDSDLNNSDWLKTLSWDLPTDVDQFLHIIGGKESLPHFMTLPAAQAMPQSLKDQLDVKGGDGSGNFGHQGRPGQVGGSSSSGSKPPEVLKLFHGTSSYAWKQIKQNGLKPKEGSRNWFLSTTSPEREISVYMTDSKDYAEQYAFRAMHNHDAEGALVLEVSIPQTELEKLKDDEQMERGLRFEGDIPPDWIKLLTRVASNPFGVDTRDSFKKIYAVILCDEADEQKQVPHDGVILWREPNAVELQIDLKAIDQAFDEGEEAIKEQLEAIRAKLAKDALAGIIDLDPADYHKLIIEPKPADITKLRNLLRDIYENATGLVLQELTDLGAEDLNDDFDVEYEGQIDDLGRITASRMANDVQARVIGTAITLAALGLVGKILYDRLKADFANLSTSYVDNAAASASHIAVNIGREAAAAANYGIIREVQYSSVLDQATCIPCQDADGETGATDQDIPMAPNPDCFGRGRCRCIHVYVFQNEKKGGEGSGHFGHEGRPGQVGGSSKTSVVRLNGKDDAEKIESIYQDFWVPNATEIQEARAISYSNRTKSQSALTMMYYALQQEARDKGENTTLYAAIGENKEVKSVAVSEFAKSTRENPDAGYDYLFIHAMGSLDPRGGAKIFRDILSDAASRGAGLAWTSAEGAKAFWRKTGLPSNDDETYLVNPEQVKTLASGKRLQSQIKAMLDWWPDEDEPLVFIDDVTPDEEKGGRGSGNYGHAGRPGLVGGSSDDGIVRNYKPITKEKRQAAAKYENNVAELIGGQFNGNNDAFDVVTVTHGVEVKTIFEGRKRPAVTMSPKALKRKRSEARKNKYKTATVVIDARSSRPQYYFREGLGSFRISNMEKVSSDQLKAKFE